MGLVRAQSAQKALLVLQYPTGYARTDENTVGAIIVQKGEG